MSKKLFKYNLKIRKCPFNDLLVFSIIMNLSLILTFVLLQPLSQYSSYAPNVYPAKEPIIFGYKLYINQ